MSLSENKSNYNMPREMTKPLAAAGLVALGDKYIMGSETWSRPLKLGAVVGAGMVLSGLVTPYVAFGLPDTALYNGAELGHRIIEVGTASALAYGANMASPAVYLPDNNMAWKYLGLISAATLGAEVIADIFAGSPVAVFA